MFFRLFLDSDFSFFQGNQVEKFLLQLGQGRICIYIKKIIKILTKLKKNPK